MAEGREIVEELRRVLDVRPFQSFAIVMDNGERYEVTGPFQVAIGQNTVVVLRPGKVSDHLPIRRTSELEIPETAI